MNIDPIIVIAGISVLVVISYFIFITIKKRGILKSESDLTTEIEKLNVPIESPIPSEKEEKFFGEIEILHHNKKIRTTKVFNQELKIGRDPSISTVIISEPTVSKLHCIIYVQENKVMLKDNNSTNGTYIDNIKITEQEIKENDTISLGKKGTVKIIFHQGS